MVGSYLGPRGGAMPLCSLRNSPVPNAKERFIIFHPLRSVDIMWRPDWLFCSFIKNWRMEPFRLSKLSSFGVCRTLGML